jgi:hypothetical protein
MSRCWSFAALAAVLGCSGPDALDAWPAALVIKSPSGQTALMGYGVNAPPAVRLIDVDGKPIAGAKVTFTLTQGAGTLTGPVAATDSDGVATLGGWSITVGPNVVTASIPGPFRVDPVRFTATGVAAAYQIDVQFLTTVSPARRAVFDSAAAHWERLIYGDVPDINIVNPTPPNLCFQGQPSISGLIDDVLIHVVLDSIDGPGSILGAASPCLIRSAGRLPLYGEMIFDTADVATLEQEGSFDEVVLHEMAHVLGFGTLWEPFGLNLLAGSGGPDPYFIGVLARAEFNRIGGTAYTGGNKVPLENMGGPGTVESHWRESVFGNELMTGFVSVGGSNPLSVVTVASMGDEGYLVNYAAADAYAHTFTTPPAAGAGFPGGPTPTIALGNDILRLPIYTVDRIGRVAGVYRR